MSCLSETLVIFELESFTLTTRFGRKSRNDALKWRLKPMSWIGSKIKFLFFCTSNILRARVKANSMILTAHPTGCLETTCHANFFVRFVQETLINRLGTGAIS